MNWISLSHLKKPSAVLAPSESSRQVGLEGLRNRPVPPIQPSSNNLRPAGKEGHLCAFSLGTICTRPIFFTQIPPTNPTSSNNNLCWQRKFPPIISPAPDWKRRPSALPFHLVHFSIQPTFSLSPLLHFTTFYHLAQFFTLPIFSLGPVPPIQPSSNNLCRQRRPTPVLSCSMITHILGHTGLKLPWLDKLKVQLKVILVKRVIASNAQILIQLAFNRSHVFFFFRPNENKCWNSTSQHNILRVKVSVKVTNVALLDHKGQMGN